MKLTDILSKLTPIEAGADLRRVMTRERVQAIQDALLALADGENIVTSGGLRKGLGKGRLRLDGGGGKGGTRSISGPVPLHVIATRPPYIPVPGSPPTEGYKRYYIEWGTVNDLLADNWDDYHDISATTFFFAKVYLRTTGNLAVLNWEVVTGEAFDSHVTPEWSAGESRPAYVVVMLGMVTVTWLPEEEPTYHSHTIQNTGGGSFFFYENIARIEPGTAGPGDVAVTRQVIYHRLTY